MEMCPIPLGRPVQPFLDSYPGTPPDEAGRLLDVGEARGLAFAIRQGPELQQREGVEPPGEPFGDIPN